jgi:hypothetical protein
VKAIAALVALSFAVPSASTTSLDHRYMDLSPRHGQRFETSSTSTSFTVRAPATNTNTNIREVFWAPTSLRALDEQECVTYDSNSSYIQEGLALRVAQHGKYLDLLTLTKNIWGTTSNGGNWIFNVSWWVVEPTGRTNFARIGYVNESAEVGGQGGAPLAAEPWNLCASVVGTTFSVLVWPSSSTMPSWSSAQSVKLPARWLYKGRLGLYAGHIHAKGSVTYTNQTGEALP